MSVNLNWYLTMDVDEDPPVEACALDLATCVYNNDLTKVTSSVLGGASCAWGEDGLEAWVQYSSGAVRGFTLGTPFVCPGGFPADNGNNLAIQATSLLFSEDGTMLFLFQGNAKVYTCATPFVMSTATLTYSNVLLVNQHCTITADGMAFYECDPGDGMVYKWDLSAPYDLTTAVISPDSVILPGNTLGLAISKCESRLYACNSADQTVDEYIFGTPGDLSTIPVDMVPEAIPNYSLDVSYTSAPGDICLSWDQRHLLVCGANATPSAIRIFSFTGDAV